jgi:hypothetical protein
VSEQASPGPKKDLHQIIESARRLGVELDEEAALSWLTAMAASRGEDVIVDVRTGVFGHRVSMLDFSDKDLEHFRRIGRIVEFQDEPGVVETALALSGSAAQSKIQSYPGDCDYFERVNIRAGTREQACSILARLMRDKALNTAKGPTYQLIEVKFGSFPEDLVHRGKPVKSGSPIAWTPEEIREGRIDAFRADGTPVAVHWEEVALQPGWCKLDWVVADSERSQLANASNMLDVTWEAPDATVTPLDGYLDPYFQEVYLDAESIPIFSKLARHVSGDALDDYVGQLEHEVSKYLTKDVNYGKAAKRMYNIFRLTGRYEEAAFVRELFDEPATLLYQVWSLVRTIDDALVPGSTFKREALVAQADRLILDVVRVLEGETEEEIVRRLLRLRDCLAVETDRSEWTAAVDAARAEAIQVVNNFFYKRLTAVPSIKLYMDTFKK